MGLLGEATEPRTEGTVVYSARVYCDIADGQILRVAVGDTNLEVEDVIDSDCVQLPPGELRDALLAVSERDSWPAWEFGF